MIGSNPALLSAVFAALADPSRRAILEQLSDGEATVGELAAPHKMSLPAVSKHLKVLEAAGLLGRRRDGRRHIINLDGAPLEEARQWIDHYRRFWEGSFDRLADYLENEPYPAPSSKP
jgi:DNA-binding transcriptional ArsR family regulator